MMMRKPRLGSHRPKRGFTLIEVMIAMVVLFFGLLAILSLFGLAVRSTQYAQEDLVAKQKAREALEAIYSARDDAGITFASIANDSSVPPGIFKTGFEPLFRVPANSNGILGTGTEGTTLDYALMPDSSGNLNVAVPLTNFQRQIQIAPVLNPDGSVNPNLKQITVTVRVAGSGQAPRDYAVTGFISTYH